MLVYSPVSPIAVIWIWWKCAIHTGAYMKDSQFRQFDQNRGGQGLSHLRCIQTQHVSFIKIYTCWYKNYLWYKLQDKYHCLFTKNNRRKKLRTPWNCSELMWLYPDLANCRRHLRILKHKFKTDNRAVATQPEPPNPRLLRLLDHQYI